MLNDIQKTLNTSRSIYTNPLDVPREHILNKEVDSEGKTFSQYIQYIEMNKPLRRKGVEPT